MIGDVISAAVLIFLVSAFAECYPFQRAMAPSSPPKTPREKTAGAGGIMKTHSSRVPVS